MAGPKSPAIPLRTSSSTRTRTACHEAGHAVLSAAIASMPEHVTIKPDANTLGRSAARMSARPTSRIQVHLAGFAAEHVLTGRRPREIDREIGFAILARVDPALRAAFSGADERDGARAVDEVLRSHGALTDDELRREVDRLYDVARESLVSVWSAVQRVAKALLEHEEIDRDGVDGAIAGADIYLPVFAVQQAHGLLQIGGAELAATSSAAWPRAGGRTPRRREGRA